MHFFNRLQKVLDGRREYTWAKGLGINRGVIRNLKEKGVTPGWETLIAIRRAEGVNVEWLTEGLGEPYLVHRHLSDAECADAVALYLADEDWTVTLATDWTRHAVILTQPGSATLCGRAERVTTYQYTITEILLGAGKQTLDAIAAGGRRLRLAELSRDRLLAILHGQAGSWRLLHAPDSWLKGAREIDATHRIFHDMPPTPHQLTHDEDHLLKLYRGMAAQQRATYKAIGDTLAQHADTPKRGNGE